MSRTPARPARRHALLGAALCAPCLLVAAPPSLAAEPQPSEPQSAAQQQPVPAGDVRHRPLGVPARSTAATGTPPQIAYGVVQRPESLSDPVDAASAVVRLDPLSGRARTVVATRGRYLSVAAWSDDRARIYYGVTRLTPTGNILGQDVDSVPQAGGRARRERSVAFDLDVSRAGDRLVYVRREQLGDREETNLFTSDAAGRGERRLTGAGGFAPRFSPNGRRVVFTRDLPTTDPRGQAEVFTIGTDGTGLTRVTRTTTSDEISGAFSPDGRRLLLTRYRDSTRRQDVWSVGVDGRGLRLVRASASDPDWAANGWISYLTRRGTSSGDDLSTQVAVRAPGAAGLETVLTRERSLVSGVRFAG